MTVGQRDAGKLSGDAYGGRWHGPVIVLTHHPPPEPHGDQHTFAAGPITGAVHWAQWQAGDKDVEVLGSNVTGQCLQAGLVDEIFVLVLPVLLGHGTPLFPGGGLDRVNLEPISSTPSARVTAMRFRVIKPAGGADGG